MNQPNKLKLARRINKRSNWSRSFQLVSCITVIASVGEFYCHTGYLFFYLKNVFSMSLLFYYGLLSIAQTSLVFYLKLTSLNLSLLIYFSFKYCLTSYVVSMVGHRFILGFRNFYVIQVGQVSLNLGESLIIAFSFRFWYWIICI
jgi:hypothetical protein